MKLSTSSQNLSYFWNTPFVKILVFCMGGAILGYTVAAKAPFLSIGGSLLLAGLILLLIHPRGKLIVIISIFAVAPFTGLFKVFLYCKDVPLILDFLLVAVIIHALTQKALAKQSQDPKIRIPLMSLPIMLFLYIAFWEIFNPFIPNLFRGLYGFRLSAFYMLAFFTAWLTIRSKEDILILMKVFVISGLIVAVYGVFQFIRPSPAEIAYITRGENWGGWSHFVKPFSTMIGPFHVGACMVLVFLANLAFLFKKDVPKVNKFVSKLIFIPLLGALLLSLTRTSYLALLIAAVSFVFLNKKEKRLRTVVKLVMLIAMAAIMLILVIRLIPQGQVVLSRLSTLVNIRDSALWSRLRAWPDRIDHIVQNPLGHGIGVTGGAGNIFKRADNQFLTVGLEMGWAGLLIFCLIILVVIKKGIKLSSSLSDPFLRLTGAWITAFTIGLLSVMMTNQILEAYPINMFFWFMIGILYRLRFIEDKQCQVMV